MAGKRGLPGYHARPLKRLVEIKSLVHWRRRQGGYTDPIAALTVAGHALAAVEGMRRRNLPRHPGFDFETADDFLQAADLDLTERDTMEVIAEVQRSRSGPMPFAMTDVIAGDLLALTREERSNLGVVTIEAIDEAPADRAARMAEWKRLNDRLRRRRVTDKKRADAGLPALDRKGTTTSGPKPWEALGLTRATYFRRRAKGALGSETVVSRTYTEANTETVVSQTYASASETAVSQTFRRNIEIVRHAGLTSPTSDPECAALEAAPERAALRRHNPQAETALLLLLGRGDPEVGRQVATRLPPERIKHWTACLSSGVLGGDERIILEYHAIQVRQSMREAS